MARRRKNLALAVILLLLCGAAARALLPGTSTRDDHVPPAPAAAAPAPAPALASTPAAAQPSAAAKPHVKRRPASTRQRAPRPQHHPAPARAGITLKLLETLTAPAPAAAVEHAATEARVEPAMPVAVAVVEAEAEPAPQRSDAGRLVFVNQCTEHEYGSADYRKCRAREARRLSFACSFYQGEVKRVAYERRAEAESWMTAYCRKGDAYRASAN